MTKKASKAITKDTSPTIQLTAEIGTKMQIELASLENRIRLTMIGVVSDNYLIYSLPVKIMQAVNKNTFMTGTSIKIRCISRGAAFGFHTTIIGITESPVRLLIVKYPDNIQRHTIRKNQRVKCLLPAKLTKNNVDINGVIADISRCGCHFQAKKSDLTQEQINITQPGETITLSLSLPGMEAKKITSATIKNTFVDLEKAQIGIEFIDVNSEILALIDNFIAMSFDLPPF